MNMIIKDILSSLSITGKYKGYHITIAACELLLEDDTRLYSVAKDLYPFVAERCNYINADVDSLERNIRTIIFRAWKKSRPKLIEIAGFDLQEPPTTTEFLGILLSYLQRQEMLANK